jgi:hypothetical protein
MRYLKRYRLIKEVFESSFLVCDSLIKYFEYFVKKYKIDNDDVIKLSNIIIKSKR